MIVNDETKRVAQEAYDYIITHPERHAQKGWISDETGAKSTFELMDEAPRLNEETVCGTTMCIGGTVDYLTTGRVTYGVSDRAATALGLEDDGESFALFFCFDNERALDMLNAIAQGDEDKFSALAWGER